MNQMARLSRRVFIRQSQKKYSYKDPIVIVGGMQLVGMFGVICMTYIVHHESESLQNRIHNESTIMQNRIHGNSMSFIKDKHNYTRAISALDHLNSIKKSLTGILYGSEHRTVSDGISQAISKYDQKVLALDDETLSNYNLSDKILKSVADEWYIKFKHVSSQDISIEEKRKDNVYQINNFRSIARDNFIHIFSIFESYNTCIAQDRASIEAQSFRVPELISGGQSREILNRYNRFVRYIGPIDVAMGYTRNDGEIYNHLEFMLMLKSCLHNEADKKALQARYDSLSVESPWFDAR